MLLRLPAVVACLCAGALLLCGPPPEPSLEEGFRNPPGTARPSTYYLWLNHYVNPDHMDKELEDFKAKGIGGILTGQVPQTGATNVADNGIAAARNVLSLSSRFRAAWSR